jgi:hypothetical protein
MTSLRGRGHPGHPRTLNSRRGPRFAPPRLVDRLSSSSPAGRQVDPSRRPAAMDRILLPVWQGLELRGRAVAVWSGDDGHEETQVEPGAPRRAGDQRSSSSRSVAATPAASITGKPAARGGRVMPRSLAEASDRLSWYGAAADDGGGVGRLGIWLLRDDGRIVPRASPETLPDQQMVKIDQVLPAPRAGPRTPCRRRRRDPRPR